jgi:hypothetical protein
MRRHYLSLILTLCAFISSEAFAVAQASFRFRAKDCRAEFDLMKANLERLTYSTVVVEFVGSDPWQTPAVDGFNYCTVSYHYDGYGTFIRNDLGAIVPWSYSPGNFYGAYSSSRHHGVASFADVYPNLPACEEQRQEWVDYYRTRTGGEVLLSACQISDTQVVNPPSGAFLMIIGTKAWSTYTYRYTYRLTETAQLALREKIEQAGGRFLLGDDPTHIYTTATYEAPRELEISVTPRYFPNAAECQLAVGLVTQIANTFADCNDRDVMSVIPEIGARLDVFEAFQGAWFFSLEACESRRPEAEALYRKRFACDGNQAYKLVSYSVVGEDGFLTHAPERSFPGARLRF